MRVPRQIGQAGVLNGDVSYAAVSPGFAVQLRSEGLDISNIPSCTAALTKVVNSNRDDYA